MIANHRRRMIFCSTLCLLIILGIGISFSGMQEVSAQPIFVTNTPIPPDPLNIPIEGGAEQYALRLWTEQDLLNVLASQLNRLSGGDTSQQNAIQYTLHELEQRYPGAPRRPEQRQRILNLMLNTPRGTVDMRSIIRPYIVEELNNRTGQFSEEIENTFVINNILVQTLPFRLDPDDLTDALITLRYPSEAITPDETLYKDHFIIHADAAGQFSMLPAAPDIPAAPFGDIREVTLVRADDVNMDGLSELALTIDRGDLNTEMQIYGWRNNQIVSLIMPGEAIVYGEFIEWTQSDATLTVAPYRQESFTWDCVSRQPVEWQWINNFYRPVIGDNVRFENLPTVGCALHASEPIFAHPAQEAIALVSNLVNDPGLNSQGAERGKIALAMLYLLAQQTRDSEAEISALLPDADSDPWLAGQINAFTISASNEDFNPIEVCAALIEDTPYGACNVDQVLTQFFKENPIFREADLAGQLETLGLPVLEVVTVSEVGRANRQVVNFDLAGASWWAFAPLDPLYYVPEPTESPVIVETTALPSTFITPPLSALDAMLEENDLVTALSVLENARRDSPDSSLSPEARYLQALAFDLLANRQAAKDAYYALWSDYPDTAYGKLAGAHLEKR